MKRPGPSPSSTWLVTGGAGYIGRHVVRTLVTAGHRVVVLDDVSSGDPGTLPGAVPFVTGSVTDPATVRRVLREHGVTGVIHLAARKSVTDSVLDPAACYRTNLVGTLALAEAMTDVGVAHVVHASSAAVYGSTPAGPVGEDTPAAPINPYGATKLAAEWLLEAVAEANGTTHTSLRYFNVAGTASPRLRDARGTSLVPAVMDALDHGTRPLVLGLDHDTPDGSCVRDYVHVSDVADAHLRVVERLLAGGGGATWNIGSGRGTSVLEVLDLVRRTSGIPFAPRILSRREGDPAGVVAAVGRAEEALGWRARRTVEQIVRSEWTARRTAPLRLAPALTPSA